MSAKQHTTQVGPTPIDADQLRGLVDAISDDPQLAQVSGRVRHRWEGGFAVDGQAIEVTEGGETALKGIAIQELEVTTEGRVDLQGLFELDDSVTPRFSSVTVTVGVRSDADAATLEALGRTVAQRSPAYDALANPVPIELNVEPRG